MCGICGFYGDRDEELLHRMNPTLFHRGPDDEGYFFSPPVGLAMRRLSIIDLSKGHQPIYNEDGTIAIVFNGEIYNFRDLREGLIQKGHKFSTHTDTETIVHGYEEWGEDCLKRLRGMFAFALWDSRKRELMLARDRVGIKPLYYTQQGSTLYFGSEIKALLAADVPRQLDFYALHQYLSFAHVPAPFTIFRGIRRLSPGHVLFVNENGAVLRRYWDLAPTEPRDQDGDFYCARIREVFDETVRIHLESDVPLGAFLSGGIDSSAIVAYMAHYTSGRVRTFSLGFETRAHHFDELPFARLVAEKFGTEHTEIPVRANLVAAVPQMIEHFDEPFANDTALLIYYLSRAVRPYVTVVLAGTGGDEAFAGYSRYTAMQAAELLRHLPSAVLRLASNLVEATVSEAADGRHFKRRLRAFLKGSLLPPTDRYISWITHLSDDAKAELYSRLMQDEVATQDAAAHLRPILTKPWTEEGSIGDQAFYADVNTYLPNDQLEYNEKMSMAHSVELRVPFCDHKLLELSASIPFSLKARRFRTKSLLKQAFRGIVPDEVLDRKKLGLHAPVGIWLQSDLGSLIGEMLSPDRVRQRGYFRPEAVSQIVQAHQSGRRDMSWPLWMLLVFELWHQIYLDRTTPPDLSEMVAGSANSASPH